MRHRWKMESLCLVRKESNTTPILKSLLPSVLVNRVLDNCVSWEKLNCSTFKGRIKSFEIEIVELKFREKIHILSIKHIII